MANKKPKSTKKLNRNELARLVTLREGKKVSLPIGQVKEVMRVITCLADKDPRVIFAMFPTIEGFITSCKPRR